MIKMSVAAHFQAENLKEQDQRCKPLLTINDQQRRNTRNLIQSLLYINNRTDKMR